MKPEEKTTSSAPLDETPESEPVVQVTAKKVADASKRGVEAGAEILQFSTKVVRRSMDQLSSLFDLAGDGAKAQDVVHRSTRNLDAVMQCSTALASGSQEIGRAWLDGVQEQVRRNVEDFGRLLSCRTFGDFTSAQSDILRRSMEDMVRNNLRLSEQSVQIARSAVQRCSTSSS